MRRHRVCFGLPQVLVAAVAGFSAAACSGTVPDDGASALLTTPSPTTLVGGVGLTGGTSRTLGQDVVMFTLDGGTFRFTSENGELEGTYSGVVTVPAEGRPKVAMDLVVTEGSDVFAGASGELVGDGSGEFLLNGGKFVLSLSGVLPTTAEPLGAKFHATVTGTVRLACSADNHIISRLEDGATIANVGKAHMELASEILETNCF